MTQTWQALSGTKARGSKLRSLLPSWIVLVGGAALPLAIATSAGTAISENRPPILGPGGGFTQSTPARRAVESPAIPSGTGMQDERLVAQKPKDGLAEAWTAVVFQRDSVLGIEVRLPSGRRFGKVGIDVGGPKVIDHSSLLNGDQFVMLGATAPNVAMVRLNADGGAPLEVRPQMQPTPAGGSVGVFAIEFSASRTVVSVEALDGAGEVLEKSELHGRSTR